MKYKYDKRFQCKVEFPETPLECVEQLEDFFLADMWYAKHAEWKTPKDMNHYLKVHFAICKKEIKRLK